MAARKHVKDLQAVANCSICQDYFNDPVILKCGHSFCRACITGYCESGDFMDISPGSYPCPRCREVFGEGEFQPNLQLRNIVNISKKIPEPRGRRTCKEHGKLLKLFCEEDGTPICLDCGKSPTHKEHPLAPADEAALGYKAWIQSRLEILKKEREEIPSFKLSGENESRELLKQLQTEKQKIVSEFQRLHQFLEEQERLLLAQLEELNKEIEKRRDEYVAKLSEELSSFSSLISEMEQKCQLPACEFLQDIKVTLTRCERKTFQNLVAFSSELKWRIWASSQRNAALKTIVKKFKDELSSRQHLDKAKRASSEEDSDTDQKKRCLPVDSLSHTDSVFSVLDSQVQEPVTWWLPTEDSVEDKKKSCLPIDSLYDIDFSFPDLSSQFQEQVKQASSEEDSDTDQKNRCLPVYSLYDSAFSYPFYFPSSRSKPNGYPLSTSTKQNLDRWHHNSSFRPINVNLPESSISHLITGTGYPPTDSPLHRPPAPRLWEWSSPTATVSHQTQASTALPWSPEGDFSSMV